MASAQCMLLFVLRLALLGILIKSALEIVLVNKETPRLIVQRCQYWLQLVSQHFWIDQDQVIRVVMKNQRMISLVYGYLALFLSVSIVLGARKPVKPLIYLIVASVVFFYVDYQRFPYFMSDKLKDIVILLAIAGGLLMIKGFNSVKPLVI